MSIRTDDELASAVDECGALLQQINDYLADRPGRSGKVRFPRGFLGTVGTYTKRYRWMNDRTLKRNLAYQYLFCDVLRWVNNRTDIWGLAKEMLVKHAIVGIGAISESLLAASVGQLGFPEARYPTRLKRLNAEGVIDDALRTELEWLWSARNAIHIYEIDRLEFENYEAADARRAYSAVRSLELALQQWFEPSNA